MQTKFVFVDNYDLVWNGKTARYHNGVSGSHCAPLYLAEALAKHPNNSVEVVSTKNNIIEDTYLNVKYINFNNFQPSDCDYIILQNDLHALKILNKILSYKKLLILTQNDLFNYNKMFNIDKKKIIICYISEFAKRNILYVQPFLHEYDSLLLYNSIDLNDITTVDLSNKENSLCFFACIERGFKLVVKILDELCNYKLYTNVYYEPSRCLLNMNNSNVIVTENSAKYTILDYIKKSKYFVYPLINLDNSCIHYDTFGYVVLEALLLGTIVITPRIGVYEELYGDAICYIKTDDIIPNEDLLNWKKFNHNFGYPILSRYVEQIKILDNDENLRNSYINKGLLLKDKFSHINIGNKLNSFLTTK